MKIGANSKTRQVDLYRSRVARRLIACVALMFISLMIKAAVAAPEDEVRATFDRFVAAQNAHDVKAVESLLLGSPDFLWITRGTPVWGHDAALKRFTALYEGTWRLDPEPSGLKITMIDDGVAQIYVPIIFTIGAAGQPPQQTRFLMNQLLVKTPSGWRVSSILPIPAPAQ
jgi:ketosteroid isomerase-like protein